jgi:hypothetical protein
MLRAFVISFFGLLFVSSASAQLKADGAPCAQERECASGVCFFSDGASKCGLPNKRDGAPCAQERECASGVCSFKSGFFSCGL